MRVLVAGASGTIGQPLVRELIRRGHSLVGLASSEAKFPLLARLGAEPMAADLLDPAATAAVVARAAPQAVVDVATRFTGSPLRASHVEPTNRLRERGTANLLAAAIAVGARRFVCESMVFYYGFGPFSAPVGEDQPPGRERSPGVQRIINALSSMERQVHRASVQGRIQGISLRFGMFHGAAAPSTQQMLELVRHRRLPLLDGGRALHSWIDVGDAARAAADALERAPAGRVYNVVDDEPVELRDYLAELVRLTQAPPPRALPAWLLRPFAPFAVEILSRARLPVSNARIRRDLGWEPQLRTYREALAAVPIARAGVVVPAHRAMTPLGGEP